MQKLTKWGKSKKLLDKHVGVRVASRREARRRHHHNSLLLLLRCLRRLFGVALSRKLVLLTRNHRDLGKVPGLLIEDWTV
jgi:hypothetical protein